MEPFVAISKSWKDEKKYAAMIAGPLGLVVNPSEHPYEILTVKGDGVSLVIYEHKTSSTGNVSARIRDNGSKNKAKAREALVAFKTGAGLPDDIRWKVATFNTFYCKSLPRN